MNDIDAVERANKYWNAHDANALAGAYAEGATFSDPCAGQGLTGEAITNYAKALWAAYPDVSVELITIVDNGGHDRRPVGVSWH